MGWGGGEEVERSDAQTLAGPVNPRRPGTWSDWGGPRTEPTGTSRTRWPGPLRRLGPICPPPKLESHGKVEHASAGGPVSDVGCPESDQNPPSQSHKGLQNPDLAVPRQRQRAAQE